MYALHFLPLRLPPSVKGIRSVGNNTLTVEYTSILQHKFNILVDLASGRILSLVQLALDE